MGIINNLRNSLAVRNAVQQTDGFNSTTFVNQQINPNEIFFGGLNRAGFYDNYYGDSNRIIQTSARHELYYSKDNEVQDASIENTFAYYLFNLNQSYPQRKVLEQIYSEMITHGFVDLFIYRKDGKGETHYFDKKYNENDFRGITLVKGYNNLTAKDKSNIVRITNGVSQANVFLGYSPTQASNAWRKMQDEMGLHMTAFAKNAGMPLGTFLITASSVDEYIKIKENLEGKIAGARNSGKVLFNYRPAEVKNAQIEWVQYTSQDVQDYTKQLEFAEKKMTQSFGVPGSVKGTNDGENYATANVSKQGFILWTIEPLVSSVREQLDFYLRQRFTLTGEIKCDVEIPELADESKIRIETTTLQVELFEKKLAEGYTAESVIQAYNLPERFLLLETTTEAEANANKPTIALDKAKTVSNAPRNDKARFYQNSLTNKERKELENGFSEILEQYADRLLFQADEIKEAIEDFESKMVAHFGKHYQKFYAQTEEVVADEISKILDVVDVANLKLTDEELLYAKEQYLERVKSFTDTFKEQVEKLQAPELPVRSKEVNSHIEMVTVTESEHTRIVSELAGWTKAQEDFPVRVYKQWHTLDSHACDYCKDLEDTTIDVTALFAGNTTDEIFRPVGGGAHPSCRCYVEYEMEAKK